jgi:flagellar biosynthesis protein FlhF
VPLKTYRGPAVAALLAQARADFGADALVLRVNERRTDAGELHIELVAGDQASIAQARRGEQAPRERPATPLVATGPVNESVAAAPARRGRVDILAFVGPTGAGKTTAVAKLASHPQVFGGRKVGLLCLDTYRVGAVEQLAHYAELGHRPVEMAYDVADLDRCHKGLADCDVILVDCPGRGPRSQGDSDAVRDLLRRIGPVETHLVLPVGLQPALARRTIEEHRARGATHLMPSKVDEYPDDWALFDLAIAMAMPMRWIGEGQRVPQDLRSAASRLESARARLRSRRVVREAGAA